jgi:uncharacterized membrane protein
MTASTIASGSSLRGLAEVTSTRSASRRAAARNRLAVAGLLLLAAIPVAGGTFRLTDMSELTADNARFVTDPVPIVVHVIAATVFAVLGAFQFAAGIRRHHNAWHRAAGALLVPTGVLVAVSGLWMTAAYEMPPADQGALAVVRYVVGAAMLAELVLAVAALVRHDYRAHGAWMTRAYALGMGAGTQVLTQAPLLAMDDYPGWARPVGMGLGWAINVVVAEVVIRRRTRGQEVARVGSVGSGGAPVRASQGGRAKDGRSPFERGQHREVRAGVPPRGDGAYPRDL